MLTAEVMKGPMSADRLQDAFHCRVNRRNISIAAARLDTAKMMLHTRL